MTFKTIFGNEFENFITYLGLYGTIYDKKHILKTMEEIEKTDFMHFRTLLGKQTIHYFFDKIFDDTLSNKELMKKFSNLDSSLECYEKKVKYFLGSAFLKAYKKYNELQKTEFNSLPKFLVEKDSLKETLKEFTDYYYSILPHKKITSGEKIYIVLKSYFLTENFLNNLVSHIAIKKILEQNKKNILNKVITKIYEYNSKYSNSDDDDDDDDDDFSGDDEPLLLEEPQEVNKESKEVKKEDKKEDKLEDDEPRTKKARTSEKEISLLELLSFLKKLQ